MKIIMNVLRFPFKWIILLLDPILRPKFKTHPPEITENLGFDLEHLELFQFAACPFCVKVRWAMRRLGIQVKIVDAKNDIEARTLLAEKGGKIKVPCLRIKAPANQERWLYESDDIVDYLTLRVSKII